MAEDKTEFRIGRSHGDIVYHHVAGREYRLDPRWAVCQTAKEAELLMVALNNWTYEWEEKDFKADGLRW